MVRQDEAPAPARRLSSRNSTLKLTLRPCTSEPVNLTVKFSVGPSLVETEGQDAATVGLSVDEGLVVVGGGGICGTLGGGGLVAAGGADVGGGAVGCGGDGGVGVGIVNEGNGPGSCAGTAPAIQSAVSAPSEVAVRAVQKRRTQFTRPLPVPAVSTTP
jgi:hypothetical protein